MHHMQQPRKPECLDPRKRNPKPSQEVQLMQPSANCSRRQNEDGSEDSDEMTVPFGGSHLLECYGMTQYDTVLKLEDFLRHLQWGSVAPVVRCACSCAALHRLGYSILTATHLLQG